VDPLSGEWSRFGVDRDRAENPRYPANGLARSRHSLRGPRPRGVRGRGSGPERGRSRERRARASRPTKFSSDVVLRRRRGEGDGTEWPGRLARAGLLHCRFLVHVRLA